MLFYLFATWCIATVTQHLSPPPPDKSTVCLGKGKKLPLKPDEVATDFAPRARNAGHFSLSIHISLVIFFFLSRFPRDLLVFRAEFFANYSAVDVVSFAHNLQERAVANRG